MKDSTKNFRSVFVYGTLRPGQRNFGLVSEFNPIITPGKVRGHTIHASKYAGFPYCIGSSDLNDVVVGELLTFSEDVWEDALQAMDWLEGYPDHYDRVIVAVELSTIAVAVGAWIYRAANPYLVAEREPKIESGDWLNR